MRVCVRARVWCKHTADSFFLVQLEKELSMTPSKQLKDLMKKLKQTYCFNLNTDTLLQLACVERDGQVVVQVGLRVEVPTCPLCKVPVQELQVCV